MYRAVAWAALDRAIDPGDRDGGGRAGPSARHRRGRAGEVDGTDVTEAIRGPEVSGAVSVVAANPEVRAVLVERQRQWVAEHGGGVVEGRDIGSVVFPDADVKIYLTAVGRRAGPAPARGGRRRPGPPGPARQHPDGRRPSGWPTGPGSSTPPTGRWRTSWRRWWRGCEPRRTERRRPTSRGRAPRCRVDTSFTPIYRFLRVLVHGLNRLLFRTTVDGADQVPDDGPGDHRPGAPFVHRLLRGLRGDQPRSSTTWPRTACGSNRLLARILPGRRGLSGPPGVGRPGGAPPGPAGARGRRGADPVPRGGAADRARWSRTSTRAWPSWPPGPGPRWSRWASAGRRRSCPRGSRLPRPRHIHLVVGEPIAAARPHRRGPDLAEPHPPAHRGARPHSIQDLYDRSVDGHRPVLSADGPRSRPAGLSACRLPTVTRNQVVTMTRAYWSPKNRLPPFLEVPEARGCHTVGRSVIRQPRLAAVMTTSAVWYWSWTRWGTMSFEHLDPEGPVAVGGVGQPLGDDGVEDRRRRACTPARRNRSVVWSTPSRREAMTKSALVVEQRLHHGRHLGRDRSGRRRPG